MFFVPFLYWIRILISLATKTSIPAYEEDPFPGSASDKANIFNVKEMFHIIQVIFCLSQKQSFFPVVSKYIGYALQCNEPKWYVKTRVASYELLVTSWKLKSTSWNSKVWVQTHEIMTSS